jgi:hypothetical protein
MKTTISQNPKASDNLSSKPFFGKNEKGSNFFNSEEINEPFFKETTIQKKSNTDNINQGNNTVKGKSNGLPHLLKRGLESLSGFDLSDVQVHNNSDSPEKLNSLAYTQGENIYLGHGQEKHLPHEGWHVVQQKQGRVKPTGMELNNVAINDDPTLESEADQTAALALDESQVVQQPANLANGNNETSSKQLVQRQVRIGGGSTRVNEADYQPGGSKSTVGSRYSVANLISDNVKRVFNNVAELEQYANGQVDYIGDVATASSPDPFWYRLSPNQLKVLGEYHHDPQGNVEDVINGLRTSRFKYEPFNEVVNIGGLTPPGTSTQTRVSQVNQGIGVAGQVNRAAFNPDLENIVFKALTGAAITRNEYIAGSPSTMTQAALQQWMRRNSTSDYSYGERAALYLSMGIHIAQDISQQSFGPPNFVESSYIMSARHLKDNYLQNQAVLDLFAQTKDADDLIAIYELTSPNNFQNLNAINDFTLALHEYGSCYIEQLGLETGNAVLQSEGQRLSANTGATIYDLNPAREEIMWSKIQLALAGGFLIVGMGNRHRLNLTPRLNAAGISHDEVSNSLTQQASTVNSTWVP